MKSTFWFTLRFLIKILKVLMSPTISHCQDIRSQSMVVCSIWSTKIIDFGEPVRAKPIGTNHEHELQLYNDQFLEEFHCPNFPLNKFPKPNKRCPYNLKGKWFFFPNSNVWRKSIETYQLELLHVSCN